MSGWRPASEITFAIQLAPADLGDRLSEEIADRARETPTAVAHGLTTIEITAVTVTVTGWNEGEPR